MSVLVGAWRKAMSCGTDAFNQEHQVSLSLRRRLHWPAQPHLVDVRLSKVDALDLAAGRRLERIDLLASFAVRRILGLVRWEEALLAPGRDAAGGEVQLGGREGCVRKDAPTESGPVAGEKANSTATPRCSPS